MEFFTLILLIAVASGIFFFFKNQQNAGAQAKSKPLKPYPPDELRIENVEGGAVIHLSGIGKDMEDFDLKVVSKHTYRQGESSWYELECDRGEDKVWIDMEEDDELELAICLKKLKLRDVAISKEDLVKMDDDEEGQFQYDGITFYYEDSDPAVFYRHSDDKNAEKYYYWDFEADSGDKFIGIEQWSNGDYDVSYSEKIRPSQVTVYSLK
ncbi:MAG: DUF4178 domain-containing protein [Nitrospinales bacterium]